MQAKQAKGFTIIELLVTVAIISVLAGIAVVGVTPYILKSKRTAVIADVNTGILAGAQYFANNGTYAGLCSDAEITKIGQAIGAKGATSFHCYTTGTNNGYCLCSELPNWAADFLTYCADNTGFKFPEPVPNNCANACSNGFCRY